MPFKNILYGSKLAHSTTFKKLFFSYFKAFVLLCFTESKTVLGYTLFEGDTFTL